jgi:hypothetical protein
MAGSTVLGKHDLVSKLFNLPFDFQGVVAGTTPICERFISFLCEYMTQQLVAIPGALQLDHITYVSKNAQWQVILSLFEHKLVTELGLTRNEWLDRHSNSTLRLEGRILLKKVQPDFSCLIAGFLESGPVLLRIVRNNPLEEIPTHSAIGYGASFALKKLAARTQGPYCSIQRTALAISEALRYSRRKSRPYVGPPAYCVVLEPNQVRQFDPNAELLRRWSKNIKNKNTETLDSEDYWKEFLPLLSTIPRTPKLPASQMEGQGQ